ncbi:DUF4253 domain-containing protein [Streptomyces sp. AK08-02]|uniref:DUF4253 domain-containing protein n=1 Tax=Streptomyces sp. AK08-02 TaxID=3028654 RepID=UPI0029AA4E48|nr:DUF4253 domain-containing protein [Streptomyces sp. AK08-02]MDX3752349.1 DUF4253 domain-containing protein [Streptomyces sp. AK08-02]
MFALPDGLPVGRFLPRDSVHAWVSDEFPEDIDELWPRLLSEQGTNGLVPLLCRLDALGRPLGPDHVDAVRLEEVLTADFTEYRRQRLPSWTDPTPAWVPQGVEPWPHDPGPPFEQWPGLAPGMPVTSAGPTPEEAVSGMLQEIVETGRCGLDECRLVLVPAGRGSDALALLGWSVDAPLALLCALLRSWEDRFGAQVMAVSGSELRVSVARPPVEAERVNRLALEHVLSTADNIVDDPPTPFPEYAAALPGRTRWSFWWD